MVADADRHVADDAGRRRRNREVTQLHFLLLHLRLQRLEPRLRGPHRRFTLLEFLLADGARRVQAARALLLLMCVSHVRLAFRPLGVLARHRRFLTPGVDADQLIAARDPLTGGDEHVRHLSLDLRLNGGPAQRLQRGDVFRHVLDGHRVRRFELDRGRRKRGRSRVGCLGFIAAGGGDADNGHRGSTERTHCVTH